MWLQSRNARGEGKIMLDFSNYTVSWITNNAKIKEYLSSLQKERGGDGQRVGYLNLGLVSSLPCTSSMDSDNFSQSCGSPMAHFPTWTEQILTQLITEILKWPVHCLQTHNACKFSVSNHTNIRKLKLQLCEYDDVNIPDYITSHGVTTKL